MIFSNASPPTSTVIVLVCCSWTPNQAVWVHVLVEVIPLCFWARHFTLTVLLSSPPRCMGTTKFNAGGSCTSQFQNRPFPPPPWAIPGHLTHVKLHIVGNLTFLSKRLSAVRNKRTSQFFASAREPRSRVIALVDSTWVFFCCCCRFM